MGMAERLSILSIRYRADPDAFRQTLKAPVLLWETAPAAEQKIEQFWDTQGKYQLNPGGDPMVFTLEKSRRPNAFGIGITLGRTQNNDVVVVEPSVSRFHCFFQYNESAGHWYVIDAESHNGTFIHEERLHPGRPGVLRDGAQVRFGGVRMRFFSPKGFELYLSDRK